MLQQLWILILPWDFVLSITCLGYIVMKPKPTCPAVYRLCSRGHCLGEKALWGTTVLAGPPLCFCVIFLLIYLMSHQLLALINCQLIALLFVFNDDLGHELFHSLSNLIWSLLQGWSWGKSSSFSLTPRELLLAILFLVHSGKLNGLVFSLLLSCS